MKIDQEYKVKKISSKLTSENYFNVNKYSIRIKIIFHFLRLFLFSSKELSLSVISILSGLYLCVFGFCGSFIDGDGGEGGAT